MADVYQILLRNGLAADVDTFTGGAGELTYDTDTGQVRVHDGSTVGGFNLAQAGGAGTFGALIADSLNKAAIGTTNANTGTFTVLTADSITKTGTLNISATVFTISNGGSESVRIDSSGNLGIGTTTIESFGGGHKTLEVSGSSNAHGGVFKTATSDSAGAGSAGTEMLMYTTSSGGTIAVTSADPLLFQTSSTERARITATGQLLVGVTVSAGKFHVQDDQDGITYIEHFNTSTGASAAVYNRLVTQNAAASGTIASGMIKFRTGEFRLINGETSANGFTSIYVGGTERARITSSGNVGIGTSSPDEKLDIEGGNVKIGVIGSNAGRLLADTTTDAIMRLSVNRGGSTGQLAFHTGADTERLRIDSSGNVGIGTTAPDGKLDIATGGTTDVVAALGGTFPAFTYRNGTGTWFHAGKHPSSDYFYIGHGATPTTNVDVVVDSSGNVGIGTSSPQEKVHAYEASVSSDPSAYQFLAQNFSGFSISAGYGFAVTAGGETFAPKAAITLERTTAQGVGTFRISVDEVADVNSVESGDAVYEFIGASGVHRWLTGGTERMRIDSSGNIHIGANASYPGQLTIVGINGEVGAGNTTDSLATFSDNGAASISVHSGSANTGTIYFGTSGAAGNTKGRLQYNHSSDAMIVYTDNTERLRIGNAGSVGIGATGNYTLTVGPQGGSGHSIVQLVNATTGTTAADGAYISILGSQSDMRVWHQENANILLVLVALNVCVLQVRDL
jgi:hypothetical protein